MVQQTIQFETVSPSEIGSGTITAFLYSGDTLAATLANITENSTLKGRHTGTVDDEAAADYRLVVKFDGYTISEPDETVTLLLAVGTYVSKRLAVLDSDAQAMVTAFNAMRSGNVFTAPALANAPTGGSGSGTGARTVTITVNDGTTVLENALVRITEGSNTFYKLTNSSGVAVLNVDDATYTVAITKAGYSYSGTSLVVNGDEAETYSMTAISISNPTAGRVARRSIPVTVIDRVT